MEFIGRGEVTAVAIIKELMPKAVIEVQVPLRKLLGPDLRTGLSQRQEKESIDIVVKRKFKKVLCVRIQDRHHSSRRFGKIDKVQKMLLNWSYHDVVDVDEIECPILFKEQLNANSRDELKKYLKPYL